MADYELLGPAEKLVTEQLRTAITSSERAARKLADGLADIDLDQIELAMLDKRKQSVLAMISPAQSVAKSLSHNELFLLMMAIFLAEPKDDA